MPRSKTTHFPRESPGQGTSLDYLAREVVQSGTAPTAACVACSYSSGYWTCATGKASQRGQDPPDGVDWLFDLASLTKPVFAVAVHRAISRGQLKAGSPLAELVPELSSTWADRATLAQLLSHRAGLLPHVELFRAMQARCAARPIALQRLAANSHLTFEHEGTSFPPVYSDLGYILAGAMVQSRFGTKLDNWVKDSLRDLSLEGVGSARQWMTEGAHPSQFVPTEVVPWRGGLLRGVVHDENAWLLSGHGMSGHAGLFGTARAVAQFGMVLLDSLAGRPSPLERSVALLATAKRPDGTLCSGFDRRTSVGSSAGSYCSEETFGHLGFTGTSLWCDPERDAVAVLLTNRVCPTRENVRIRRMRPLVHDALFRWADNLPE